MTAPQTIGELENRLFAAFPREDAESWDQPGLAVGDRTRRIGKIAVALDMSVANVIAGIRSRMQRARDASSSLHKDRS